MRGPKSGEKSVKESNSKKGRMCVTYTEGGYREEDNEHGSIPILPILFPPERLVPDFFQFSPTGVRTFVQNLFESEKPIRTLNEAQLPYFPSFVHIIYFTCTGNTTYYYTLHL